MIFLYYIFKTDIFRSITYRFFHLPVTVFPLLNVSLWNKTILMLLHWGLTKRARVVLFTEHKEALMGFSASRQTAWLLTHQCFCSNSMDTQVDSGTTVLWSSFFQSILSYIVRVDKWGFIVIFMHFCGLKCFLSIYSTHFFFGTLQHSCFMCMNLPERPAHLVIAVIV